MRITPKKGLIAVGTLAVIGTAAWAAGNWSTLPQVGMSSFCASTVSGVTLPTAQGAYGVTPGSTQGTGTSICGQTVPAGPTALTGSEIVPADTQAANSTPPQTVTIPITLFPGGSYVYAGPYTTSFSYAIPNSINTVILDPTGTVSAATLTMPTTPLNGQVVNIASTHTVTALVFAAVAGQTISNAPTAITVSTTTPYNYAFMWDATTSYWYRLQ